MLDVVHAHKTYALYESGQLIVASKYPSVVVNTLKCIVDSIDDKVPIKLLFSTDSNTLRANNLIKEAANIDFLEILSSLERENKNDNGRLQ